MGQIAAEPLFGGFAHVRAVHIKVEPFLGAAPRQVIPDHPVGVITFLHVGKKGAQQRFRPGQGLPGEQGFVFPGGVQTVRVRREPTVRQRDVHPGQHIRPRRNGENGPHVGVEGRIIRRFPVKDPGAERPHPRCGADGFAREKHRQRIKVVARRRKIRVTPPLRQIGHIGRRRDRFSVYKQRGHAAQPFYLRHVLCLPVCFFPFYHAVPGFSIRRPDEKRAPTASAPVRKTE